jgi:alpha-galactosidase
MAKITFIGAGSLGFFKTLIIDSLSFDELRHSDWALVDVDPKRLDYARRIAERIMREAKSTGKLTATLDRREVLAGSDFVIMAILVGGYEPIAHDIDIPMKYGVDQCIGDSHGPGGVFRALRTIPVKVGIARDIAELCPNAWVLNYTNPMSMLCRAMDIETGINLVGLCHSVQGTTGMLAEWAGAPPSEIDHWVAGINHQAWVLRIRHNGEDLYPKIKEAARTPEHWNSLTTSCEMLEHLGYFVTEGSGHNSEYNAWFRKTPDSIAKYCPGGSWNGGSGYIKQLYGGDRKDWEVDQERYASDTSPIEFRRSHEYGSNIVNGIHTHVPFRFNGNVANKGLITNLPNDVMVEVPCFADKNGVKPCHVGALPPQLAALNSMNVNVIEMAVQAALTGDRDAAYHACCFDPLTMAVLDLRQIRSMVDELFEAEKPWLPQFK